MASSKKSSKSVKKVYRSNKKVIDKKEQDVISKRKIKSLESEIIDLNITTNEESEALVVVNTEEIEVEVDEVIDLKETEKSSGQRDMIEQIMFRLPCVPEPLIGSPQQVQKELDALAKKMQKNPTNDKIFDKIHLYMHGYLINVVLKKFPFIRGLQTVDVYQETLIALRFKAIPGFKYGKGMSFINFAKMCIRRHLITLLNASKNRKKDQSINQAISLDSSPSKDDEDGNSTTYSNIIADNKCSVDKTMETNEAYAVTKKALFSSLSDFEKIVLEEYLANSSYKEISRNISKILKKRANTKSIDNALLRIRKKAVYLMKHSRKEDLPIFLPKKSS